ncbi:MAG: glycosyltransferase [Clostridia bacterium]|nr:glycosyltransferase [Clostridia bacterium]
MLDNKKGIGDNRLDRQTETLLSIIVPVYNVENYLDDCLKSLTSQDLSNERYEIVCVDDGSTDGSLLILKDYAEKFPNIRIIEKLNGGVSSARNEGIKNANGEYIWFIDSDDCIRSDCLGQVADILKSKTPEQVFISFKCVDEDYKFAKQNILLEYHLSDKHSTANVCGAIIKSQIIKDNNISFELKMKYGEDTLFMYYVYLYSSDRDTIEINSPLYYYRQRSTSAMHQESVDNITKHTEDLISMAYTYKKTYDNGILDKHKKENTRLRQYWAIEGALTIMPQSSLNCEEVLGQLKKDGLYPYPTLWKKFFGARGLKAKLVQFPKLFFKYKLLYKIYYKMRRK